MLVFSHIVIRRVVRQYNILNESVECLGSFTCFTSCPNMTAASKHLGFPPHVTSQLVHPPSPP